VSDNDCGDLSQSGSDLVDCFLNHLLVLFVKSTSGLVEKEDLRFLDESSSDGNSLLLASRKLTARLSNICIEAVGAHLLSDKVISIRILKGFDAVFVCGVFLTQQQIFFN